MGKEIGLILGWVRTGKEFNQRMQIMFDHMLGVQLFPKDLLALGEPLEKAEALIRSVHETNFKLLENPQFPRFLEPDRERSIKSGMPPLSPIYPYFLESFSLTGNNAVASGILFFMQPFTRPMQFVRGLEMLCSTVSMLRLSEGLDPIPDHSDPRSWLYPLSPAELSGQQPHSPNNPILNFINEELEGIDKL